jgi:hypothetical protein
MKRVMLAILSGLLLSCQGPAAVLAQDIRPSTRSASTPEEVPSGVRARQAGAGG